MPRKFIVSVLLLASCRAPSPTFAVQAAEQRSFALPPAYPCARYSPVTQTGRVQAEGLRELSGMTASRQHKGVFWAHNDAGHKPKLWAIDSQGRLLAEYKLKHQANIDWEDIASGPCPLSVATASVNCLYLADTGDNSGSRPLSSILRWPEPLQLAQASTVTVKVDEQDLDAFDFTYPDGPHNIESLAVLPDGRCLLLTKDNGAASQLFRVTLSQPHNNQVESMGHLPVLGAIGKQAAVTAADLTADGHWLIVRTRSAVWLMDATDLSLTQGQLGDRLGRLRPFALPDAPDAHGEAVAWDSSGDYWLISEGLLPSIWQGHCVR